MADEYRKRPLLPQYKERAEAWLKAHPENR